MTTKSRGINWSNVKYRAWVKRYEKYLPIKSIEFDPISGEPNSITVVATGGQHLKLLPIEIILEQYTDLKDSNGKEIFGGVV